MDLLSYVTLCINEEIKVVKFDPNAERERDVEQR